MALQEHAGDRPMTVTLVTVTWPAAERPSHFMAADLPREGAFQAASDDAGWILVFRSATKAARWALQWLANGPSRAARPAILLHTGEAGASFEALLRTAGSASLDHVTSEAAALQPQLRPGQVLCSAATALLLNARQPADLRVLGEIGDPGCGPPRLHRVVPAGDTQPDLIVGALPVWHNSFIGRASALRELRERLDEGRLVTVTGPAGVGKTRFAAEAARRCQQTSETPVRFVSLQECATPERLPELLLSAFHQPLDGGDARQQLLDAAAPWTGLLVLDNFEHLLEGGAQLVERLLDAARGLRCLVTSRERLELAGEHVHELAPLTTPTSANARDAACAESVQLLLDRLAEARGERPQDGQLDAALIEVCCQLDGLPLALELAAARLAAGAGTEDLGALLDTLALCDGEGITADGRHQSLRAAIDWSYRRLEPELQRFFRQLAVFGGSWTLEAAEDVCNEPFAIDYLEALHRASLVLVEEHGGDLRYRLLEAMRAFGAEQLTAEGEADIVAARHYEIFLGYARSLGDTLEHQGESAGVLARLDGDLGNYRTALAWARMASPAAALNLAAALWRFWLVRGYWREAHAILAGLAKAMDDLTADDQIRLLGWLGHLEYRLGHNPAAHQRLEQAAELASQLGNREAGSHAVNELGKLCWAEGDYARARALFEQALAARRELGNPWGVAATLANLGAVVAAQGEPQQARALVEEGLSIRRRIADRRGEANSLNNLGVLAYQLGDWSEALELLAASSAIRRDLGDQAGVASCLNDAGSIALARGDLVRALDDFAESLELRRELGDLRGVARTLNNLGIVAKEQADFDSARACYEEALALNQQLDDPRGLGMTATNLGDVCLADHDPAAAEQYFRQALAIAEQLGDRRGLALAETNLGHVAALTSEAAAAERHYRASLAVSERLGDAWLSAANHHGLGEIAMALGDLAVTRQEFARSLHLRRGIQDLPGIADSLRGMAAAFSAGGRPQWADPLIAAAEAVNDESLSTSPEAPLDWRSAIEFALQHAGQLDAP